MNEKTEMYLLIGGVAIVAVFFIMSKGTTTGGLSFVSPNPQSVAAVETANTSIAQSYQNAGVSKALAAVDLLKTQITTTGQVQQTANTNAANIAETSITANDALATSRLQNDAAVAINQANNQAAVATANAADQVAINGQSASLAAAKAADSAAVNVANNQTTQVQAAAGAKKQGNIIGGITSALGDIAKLFGL